MKDNIAVNLLLEQLKDAHTWLEGTMEGVTDEVAAYMPPGKANPIAGTYAHVIMSEDFFVHGLLKQTKPLMETDFLNNTGASELQPTEWQVAYPKWLKEVKVDVAQMRLYAKAVYKASEDYVASLTDKDLTREIDMSAWGMGKRTVSSIIGGMIVGHARDIMGEISVLKGIQGLKGYPF